MVGRPKKPKGVTIRLKMSARLYEYLGHLARRTILGGDENDVATYVLTKQLETMIAARYHETELPPAEDEIDNGR